MMRFETLCGAMFMLFAMAGSAVAQPVPVLPPSAVTGMTGEQADVKASVATTKADIKTSAATRQQIQALRQALRAKLAAMRH